jgi:hypothetical protein
MFYAQDLSENVTSLEIATQAHKVIYSIPIGQININDVLQITAEFEATNPFSYNVMIGSRILLCTSDIATTGVLVSPANAFNITPGNHHGVVTKARNWKSTLSYTNYHLNLVAWAGSVNALPGQMLQIEQAYGHLDVYIP